MAFQHLELKEGLCGVTPCVCDQTCSVEISTWRICQHSAQCDWLHSCLYKYTLLCVWMDSWTGAPFPLKNHKECGFLHCIHIIKSNAKPSCCCRPINLLGATFELQTAILWVSNYNPNPEDNKCMKNKPLEKNSISLQNSEAVSLLDLQGQLKHFLWYQNTRTRTAQAFPWVAHHIRTRMCQAWKLQPLLIAISGKWSEEHVFELSSSDLCLDWCFANLSFVAHSVSCISMSPHGSIRNKVCVCVTLFCFYPTEFSDSSILLFPSFCENSQTLFKWDIFNPQALTKSWDESVVSDWRTWHRLRPTSWMACEGKRI
jgi:hypothetical protein